MPTRLGSAGSSAGAESETVDVGVFAGGVAASLSPPQPARRRRSAAEPAAAFRMRYMVVQPFQLCAWESDSSGVLAFALARCHRPSATTTAATMPCATSVSTVG